MAKSLPAITFDFSADDEAPKEFLSGQPAERTELPKQKSKRGRRSLKETVQPEEEPDVPEDEVLFQKAYYSVREAAGMFKVTVSQLRSWAIAFDDLEPRKNRRGDRLFRPQDIKTLQLIHDLIRRRKFTIEGAREYLKKNANVKETHELIVSLQKIKTFLLELRANM